MPLRRLIWLGLIVILLGAVGCGRRARSPQQVRRPAPKALPYRLVPVLCYHHLTENPKSAYDVTPADFQAQLRLLKSQGYQSILCQQLADYLAGSHNVPEKSVLITFDDGRASFKTAARPLLEEMGYRAALFINPATIGGKDYLTWADVRELQQAGYEINSHTYSHLNLTKKPPGLTREKHQERVRQEMLRGYQEIEKHLGQPPVALAYPFGNYDLFAMRTARETGHRLAFSLDPGVVDNKSDPWALPRKMIVKGTSLKALERFLQTQPLHLTGWQPPRGARVSSRNYRFTAYLADPDAAGQLGAEAGKNTKLKYDPATWQIVLTSRLNRGANLVRVYSSGAPRREIGWIVVADGAD